MFVLFTFSIIFTSTPIQLSKHLRDIELYTKLQVWQETNTNYNTTVNININVNNINMFLI